MDAFINDGGNTTCIIGFNQKFDQMEPALLSLENMGKNMEYHIRWNK